MILSVLESFMFFSVPHDNETVTYVTVMCDVTLYYII